MYGLYGEGNEWAGTCQIYHGFMPGGADGNKGWACYNSVKKAVKPKQVAGKNQKAFYYSKGLIPGNPPGAVKQWRDISLEECN